MYEPRPGDIGLATSNALTGLFVRASQALIGDWSLFTHAFVVLHDGQIIEAMPGILGKGGAKFASLDKYRKPTTMYSRFRLTPDQRDTICDAAIRMEGTPYSFLDYLSLMLTHYKINPKWVRKRVHSSGHMICSQLAAEAYRRAGVELFPDQREPMDVTPGDLGWLFFEHYGEDLSVLENPFEDNPLQDSSEDEVYKPSVWG